LCTPSREPVTRSLTTTSYLTSIAAGQSCALQTYHCHGGVQDRTFIAVMPSAYNDVLKSPMRAISLHF
jgi:hypothetical protein